jgi:hypothetical protein
VIDSLGNQLARWLDVRTPNPAFALSIDEAAREAVRMRADPRPLARPVVVIGGYRAWTIASTSLASRLCAMTCHDPTMFAGMAYPWSTDFSKIAARVCALVERRWPSADPHGKDTREVDVVGVSMGGLVARAAAAGLAQPHTNRRLRIGRLFTLGTPHRGAKLAELARPDAAARDMRPGSPFLTTLDGDLANASYELVCYTRLRDTWVGASRTAPPGHRPHWVSGWRVLSHVTISMDTRILVDIARRLRREPPMTGQPGPPPHD